MLQSPLFGAHLCWALRVCWCVFMKLHIIVQPSPVILMIRPMVWGMSGLKYVCICVYRIIPITMSQILRCNWCRFESYCRCNCQEHDDGDGSGEQGSGGGRSSLSSKTLTFSKLKEMGVDMKVGVPKIAEKKVRVLYFILIFQLYCLWSRCTV